MPEWNTDSILEGTSVGKLESALENGIRSNWKALIDSLHASQVESSS